MIYGEYSKVYDFYDDFFNLTYYLFELRVQSLDGRIKDLFNLRYKVLSGAKMDKHERKAGRKALNSKQVAFMQQKEDELIIKSMQEAPSQALDELIKRKGG